MTQVEQWDIFEASLDGSQDGNPFIDVKFGARFTHQGGENEIEIAGFYDGDGVYRVRFMPEELGAWNYVTTSNRAELDGKTGEFTCIESSDDNHGPVRVNNTFHFAYADGTPHFSVGTTAYVWNHQGEAMETQTLETLKNAPFNKIRMCVFPKHYAYNQNEPEYHAFERINDEEWDYTRFNPEFFRHLEQRIGDLRELGIEADLILFHPYDRWGYSTMDAESDDRYLKYLIARLASYRNIWWSMANEYDFMMERERMAGRVPEKLLKRIKDEPVWDHLFQVVQANDPYEHLRSIHNGWLLYNHTHPWVTHASIQNGAALADYGRAQIYRRVYRKPIVFDEVRYEGNIPQGWGDISAETMVYYFWHGTIAGAYVGHGETYQHPEDILWWSKGGVLHGESPKRIAFLRQILEQGPQLEPGNRSADPRSAGVPGEYYLIYLGEDQLKEWEFTLPKNGLEEGLKFQAEVIDTWDMTITPVDGVFEVEVKDKRNFGSKGNRAISLPGKPYMALRLRKVD